MSITDVAKRRTAGTFDDIVTYIVGQVEGPLFAMAANSVFAEYPPSSSVDTVTAPIALPVDFIGSIDFEAARTKATRAEVVVRWLVHARVLLPALNYIANYASLVESANVEQLKNALTKACALSRGGDRIANEAAEIGTGTPTHLPIPVLEALAAVAPMNGSTLPAAYRSALRRFEELLHTDDVSVKLAVANIVGFAAVQCSAQPTASVTLDVSPYWISEAKNAFLTTRAALRAQPVAALDASVLGAFVVALPAIEAMLWTPPRSPARAEQVMRRVAEMLISTKGTDWSAPTFDVSLDRDVFDIVSNHIVPALRKFGVRADERTAVGLLAEGSRDILGSDIVAAASIVKERAERAVTQDRTEVAGVPVGPEAADFLSSMRRECGAALGVLTLDTGALVEATLDQLLLKAGNECEISNA